MHLDRELEVALAAARAAASLVQEVYTRSFTVQWKEPGDPITEADRRANDLLMAMLRQAFPADAICAEEDDLVQAAQQAARGGRCWFVDPLDGTREFISRSGEFCVMVGLAVDGRATLGMVAAPAWGRTFVGVVGHEAYEVDEAGRRRVLRVPGGSRPERARLVLSRLHRNSTVEKAAERLGITSVRECGSTGLKLMLVASGEVDLYLHTGPGQSSGMGVRLRRLP